MRAKSLTVKQVEALIAPGLYCVAPQLYIAIAAPPNAGRSWVFRMSIKGKQTKRGLGSCADLSLAEAKMKAAKTRIAILEGTFEPTQPSPKGMTPTFAELAEPYIKAHESIWAEGRGGNWRYSLATHAAALSGMPVDTITAPHVANAIRHIWHAQPNTAKKLRGRIESVLEYARVHGHRSGPNPATWKGALSHLLPKLDFSKSKRLAALPLAEIPTLAAELVRLNSPSSKMLLFTLLCANRSGGIYNAKWTEVDLDRGAWTIPKDRTKTKRDDFRIPLSGTAVSLLKSMLPPNGEHVFAHKTGKPFSDAAMLMCIKGIYPEVTVHGTVRQGFKNWAAENGYPEDLSEMALDHKVGGSTRNSYFTSDLWARRTKMMSHWENFVMKKATALTSKPRGSNPFPWHPAFGRQRPPSQSSTACTDLPEQ